MILHLAVFLAGWTGVFGRLITLSGLPLVWHRMWVSVATLGLVLALTHRLHRVGWKALLKIGGCGAILATHWVAFFASIQLSNVSIGVACVATSCFFTTLFNPLINRKRISWAEVLISFISIAGVLLIFSLDVRYRIGIVLGLTCAALYSVFSILNVNVSKETGEDSATMLLYELIGGVLFLTLCMPLYAYIFEGTGVRGCVGARIILKEWMPSSADFLWLILLGSVFTVLPFLFQLQALVKLSPFSVSLAYNLEPVYSIAIAAILFGELREVNFSFWLGISLIVISVLIQTFRVMRDEG